MSAVRRMAGRPGRLAFHLLVAAIYGFLLAAPLAVVAYSFSPTVVFRLPPTGFTLRWYVNLLGQPRLLAGLRNSLLIGAFATTAGLLVGVPAAYAITRTRLPGRRVLAACFLSPLTLPGLVLAIGILVVVVSLVQPAIHVTLVGQLPPLLAAHLIVTVPWIIRTVGSSLQTMDPALEEAARGLGASPVATFFLVTLPVIRPGVVAGAIFAFIVSFGNFALSLFFASGDVTTLPVAIFEYVDRFQDPTVAAVSAVVIAATTAVVVAGSRLARVTGARSPGPQI